jgi:hypothetical protein
VLHPLVAECVRAFRDKSNIFAAFIFNLALFIESRLLEKSLISMSPKRYTYSAGRANYATKCRFGAVKRGSIWVHLR